VKKYLPMQNINRKKNVRQYKRDEEIIRNPKYSEIPERQ
jgi:hypothetical protein